MLAVSKQQERSRIVSGEKLEVAGDMRQRAPFFHCCEECLLSERFVRQRRWSVYDSAGFRIAENHPQFPRHARQRIEAWPRLRCSESLTCPCPAHFAQQSFRGRSRENRVLVAFGQIMLTIPQSRHRHITK